MKRLGRFLLFIAVLIFLLVLFRLPFGGALREGGDELLGRTGGPLWSAGLRFREVFSIGGRASLQRENESLRQERDGLAKELAELKTIREENHSLRGLLDFKEREGVELLPARLIGGSTEPDQRTADIDLGSEQGVAEGEAVVTNEGIVVGKVTNVRASVSTIELLTDPRSRFAAIVFGSATGTIPGVVEGGHGTGMILQLIPQQSDIRVGDLAVTSGLEPRVPRGLVLGRIEAVSTNPNEPFKTASISPLADLESLATVAVVKENR